MVFSVRILYDKSRSVQSVLYAALYLQFQPAQKEDYPMMKSVSAWKQELSSGAHAARLASLYCCAPEETAPQAARYEAALNGLETTFGPHAEAGLYSAPGRTEIGGNHTDHQHGRVLAGSVNIDMIAAAAPNSLNQLRVQSEGYDLCVISLDDLTARKEEENTTISLPVQPEGCH